MQNSETVGEVKSKQPTGSSKRKRKQSIKRNVILDSDSPCSDDIKPSKAERYGKRVKSDKGKSGKDGDDNIPTQNESKPGEESSSVHVKIECAEDGSSKQDGSSGEEKCNNLSGSESSAMHCSSTKQQCQNCKFCSEHLIDKQETDDCKEGRLRNKKKFTCEICAKDGCTKVYSSVEKHRNHMATVHDIPGEEVKKFECTDCPVSVWFSSKSKFTYHLGTKHPGVIKFICEVCTETFKLKANYKSHMKTHNVVVPKKFFCDVCNGSFVNKAGFEAHKRRFPGPHIKQNCAHCGFSFSREKHLRNHRCKTLLMEAAARALVAQSTPEPVNPPEAEDPLRFSENAELKATSEESQIYEDKKTPAETEMETELTEKKLTSEGGDPQANKRVVFHRIIQRRNQDQTVYRPVQMQTQTVPESVVVQELREIDFEGGTFIAAAAEPEQQFIVRDVNGHLLQGNQILQLDINDVQPGEESQVYLADWNIVAPYVIREKSP